MKETFLTIILQVVVVYAIFAQSYTLSGYVKDSITGEVVIGAYIYEKNANKSTITNPYGFYSLNLTGKDSIQIQVSFIGYDKQTVEVDLNKNTQLNFLLVANNQIETIRVNSNFNALVNEGTTAEIPVSIAKLLPSIGGETDLIKTMQLMPGIQTAGEGSSQLIVRGGSPDQNLILLDDVPLYYANHLGGFISAFNPYSIKKVRVIKGGFPAEYGGRLSSIIDVRTKDGNMKKIAGEYSIGILSAKLTLEAPIIKDKVSFIFSGRKGLLDLYSFIYIKAMPEIKESAGYNFYDYNLKFNYIASDKSRFYLGNYSSSDIVFVNFKQSKDNLASTNRFNTGWNNTVTNLKWNYVFSDKLFSNFIFAHSYYSYFNNRFNSYKSLSDTVSNYIDETSTAKYSSKINDFILKTEFNYNLNYHNQIKFGFNTYTHSFAPGNSEFNVAVNETQIIDTAFRNNNIITNEIAFFVSNNFKIGKKIKGNFGIYSAVYFTPPKRYFSPEPRLMLSYAVNKNSILKSSFSKMSQFVHLLSTAGVGTPADFWVPTTDKIPPQKSYQCTFGTDFYFKNKTFLFGIEAFYKELDNLIELKEGETLLWTTDDWQNTIEINGKGTVYGLEVLIQKQAGKLTGWIAYTLSKNTRHFENLNMGKPYPYIYDRTHNFSATAVYKIGNFSFSGSWLYLTGNAITLAYGKYETIYFDNEFPFYTQSSGYNDYLFREVYMFSEKNNFRMPATHHLSISANWEKQKKRGVQILGINIYNVYNRKNPYMLFYQRTNNSRLILSKITLFPIIPSISYSFKF